MTDAGPGGWLPVEVATEILASAAASAAAAERELAGPEAPASRVHFELAFQRRDEAIVAAYLSGIGAGPPDGLRGRFERWAEAAASAVRAGELRYFADAVEAAVITRRLDLLAPLPFEDVVRRMPVPEARESRELTAHGCCLGFWLALAEGDEPRAGRAASLVRTRRRGGRRALVDRERDHSPAALAGAMVSLLARDARTLRAAVDKLLADFAKRAEGLGPGGRGTAFLISTSACALLVEGRSRGIPLTSTSRFTPEALLATFVPIAELSLSPAVSPAGPTAEPLRPAKRRAGGSRQRSALTAPVMTPRQARFRFEAGCTQVQQWRMPGKRGVSPWQYEAALEGALEAARHLGCLMAMHPAPEELRQLGPVGPERVRALFADAVDAALALDSAPSPLRPLTLDQRVEACEAAVLAGHGGAVGTLARLPSAAHDLEAQPAAYLAWWRARAGGSDAAAAWALERLATCEPSAAVAPQLRWPAAVVARARGAVAAADRLVLRRELEALLDWHGRSAWLAGGRRLTPFPFLVSLTASAIQAAARERGLEVGIESPYLVSTSVPP